MAGSVKLTTRTKERWGGIMAAFCTACGAEVEAGRKFCGKCGAPVEAANSDGQGQGQAQWQGQEQGQGAAGSGSASYEAGPGYGAQQAGAGPQQGQQASGTSSQGGQQLQQTVDNFIKTLQNTPDFTAEMDPADIEKNKAISCVSYPLFFIPMLSCPDSKYGKFHANQGLLAFAACIAGWIVSTVIYMVFRMIFLWWLARLIGFVISVSLIVLIIVGIINAYSGKARELPFIGSIRILK